MLIAKNSISHLFIMSDKATETKREKRERKEKKKGSKKAAEEVTEEVQNDEVESSSEDAPKGDSKKVVEEELEIDLSAGVPLSKKQQRLLKKGKLNVEKLAKKHPTPKRADEEETEPKSIKSPFGVWIGNLSFDTTREDLIRFIVGKTKDFEEDKLKIAEADITRVNLPKKNGKIKGFAYVDLPSQKHVDTVVLLSESHLNGRNLLIKSSNSFEGRPEGDSKKALSKNPPLRILFVGNLSFDTSESDLEEHFRHCGDIVKIRMATFEDSGKCKGFAFIDFKDESGPTAALKSKLAKQLINRPLRLEYGEDRSKRTPNRLREQVQEGEIKEAPPVEERQERPAYKERPAAEFKPKKRAFNDAPAPGKRLKSSVALATAQRASAAIVPSQGKKITFD